MNNQLEMKTIDFKKNQPNNSYHQNSSKLSNSEIIITPINPKKRSLFPSINGERFSLKKMKISASNKINNYNENNISNKNIHSNEINRDDVI